MVEHNFIMNAVIGDAPEHIIRLTYVTISIFDLVAAALLIAGILMVILFVSICISSYDSYIHIYIDR